LCLPGQIVTQALLRAFVRLQPGGDRGEEGAGLVEVLHSIARVQPSCQDIVEEVERVSTGSA
jgi:hypothetical protein